MKTEIRKELAKGIVKFSYFKKNGTLRHAIGTTNPKILKDEAAIPSGRGQAINSNTEDWTAYYDLEKQGWRSFSTSNFKEIEG